MSYQILTFDAFSQKESMEIINNYTLSGLVYIMHSKNKKFNQEHIKRAQMLEVLLLDKNKNVYPDLYEIANIINNTNTNAFYQEHPKLFETRHEYCENSCKCKLCKALNNVKKYWETFNPTEEKILAVKTFLNIMQMDAL